MTSEELIQSFSARYGSPCRLFYAPGRVNLIGEHTDYNEGFVFPFAVDCGTVVAAAPRSDRRVYVHSLNRGESALFDLDDPAKTRRGIWLDYVEGMARSLETLAVGLRGADLLILSEVPLGAGLSSSAALEISVGMALCAVSDAPASPMMVVRAAHRAENEYVGTQSGIMDPYVATFGQEGNCLLIDCRSLQAKLVPFQLGELAILICNTGVKHSLSSSEYNVRWQECQDALRLIRRYLAHAQSLRDVSFDDFAQFERHLPVTLANRCRHVITENERTLAAAEALEKQRFGILGRLMGDSHRSLRLDYEVSSPELDLLVQVAEGYPGVLGSRMTGGGFGGCTITLLSQSALDGLKEALRDSYHRKFARVPTFRLTAPSAGARELPC
jgi:galactokinase